MNLIIIEGIDQCGKSSLIRNICKYYNYDNIVVRHFAKPPNGLSPKDALNFQMLTFFKETQLLYWIKESDKDVYKYFETMVFYNRSYLGEYVYGQMFRGLDKDKLKKHILKFEKDNILKYEPKLIMLTANPSFCLEKEDGNSFSQTLEQKTIEIQLFDEIFEKSSIKDKLKIKVDDFGRFIPKEDVLKRAVKFLEQ